MEIKIHETMDQQSATGCERTNMESEIQGASRLEYPKPGFSKQEYQKQQSAEAPDHARFRQGFYVIVMGMINNLPVIQRFISRKYFLQSAETGPLDGMG